MSACVPTPASVSVSITWQQPLLPWVCTRFALALALLAQCANAMRDLRDAGALGATTIIIGSIAIVWTHTLVVAA